MELSSYTVIRTRGWTAWVDKYAASEHGNIYFLSMVGRQTAVKAIAAALLTNRSDADNIYLSDPRYDQLTITKEFRSKWKNKHLKLSATSYQQIVVNNSTHFKPTGSYHQQHFAMIVPPGSSPELTFFQFLDRRVAYPLHPSWANWLFRLHRPKPYTDHGDEGIHPLRSLGCAAYWVNIIPEYDLQDAITKAIVTGELTIAEERS